MPTATSPLQSWCLIPLFCLSVSVSGECEYPQNQYPWLSCLLLTMGPIWHNLCECTLKLSFFSTLLFYNFIVWKMALIVFFSFYFLFFLFFPSIPLRTLGSDVFLENKTFKGVLAPKILLGAAQFYKNIMQGLDAFLLNQRYIYISRTYKCLCSFSGCAGVILKQHCSPNRDTTSSFLYISWVTKKE